MVKNNLINKKCIPCQGGTLPLNHDEATKLLKEVSGTWRINELGHLYNEYTFKDFMEPMNFANKIAELAEKEGHHPDLYISWGNCKMEIWTHKIHGLTESDFILAAKIDKI
jgi:4a-hydroxytetrahydrobiopterin dehydratase